MPKHTRDPVVPPFMMGPRMPDPVADRIDDRVADLRAQAKEDRLLKEMYKHSNPYEVALSGIIEKEDGSFKVERFVFDKATPEMVELSEMTVVLFTGLMWKNLTRELRVELVLKLGLQDGAAECDDVLQVLPAASMDYLRRWQRLINDGSAFNNAATIGMSAKDLITAGYCLEAPTATEGKYNRCHSRHDVPAGMPGSPAFVQTVMSETYLMEIEALR